MKLVETNILVYAHRKDSEFHKSAYKFIKELAEGLNIWGIPWHCLHEFISVVTHPKIYKPASTLEQALKQIDTWLESPTLQVLSENKDHWQHLKNLCTRSKLSGPMIYDARIAAIAIDHKAEVIYTCDRDFSRFKEVTVENPL